MQHFARARVRDADVVRFDGNYKPPARSNAGVTTMPLVGIASCGGTPNFLFLVAAPDAARAKALADGMVATVTPALPAR